MGPNLLTCALMWWRPGYQHGRPMGNALTSKRRAQDGLESRRITNTSQGPNANTIRGFGRRDYYAIWDVGCARLGQIVLIT